MRSADRNGRWHWNWQNVKYRPRIAKMIPGVLLLEFMSYDHIVELMTPGLSPTFALNEIEHAGS
jgi:hypothetical protein